MARTDATPADETARISDFVLGLYRRIGELPAAGFKDRALDDLREVLPFDSAFWAEGAESGATIFDAHVHGSVHPAAEWLKDYADFKTDDPLANAVFANRGVTIYDVGLMPREQWLAHPVYGPFCRKHRIEYALCTLDYDPLTTLVEVISIYRASADEPFSETERQRMQFLFPHLLEARRRNLQAGGAEGDCPEPHAEDTAVCGRDGTLRHAGRRFVGRLRAEFPQWRGPALPPQLNPDGRRRTVFEGRQSVFIGQPYGALWLLSTREYSPIDTLTPSERRTARVLIEGLTWRDGAARLGITISTFNKHAHNLYRKLGVASRAALARRFATQLRQRP